MNTRTTIIIASILILAGLAAGLLLYNRLPDPMPSHWNVYDQVDGYMPKFWGVFLMPLITLAMLLLFLGVPAIDPLKANIATFRPVFNLFILLLIAFMLYVQALTLAWALGYQSFKISSAMLPFMGLLFMGIGWMMRASKRNFFIGIRTPWTLSSDSVWDQTHRVGSILFMFSGLLAVIGAFFGGPLAFWFVLAPVILSAIFLMVYSYVLYQRETRA
jgi:uncharacterized membrane protein